MLIELKDRREIFGNDKRAINRHSIRIYQDPTDKRLYQLDKTLDGIPPFYTVYGPFTEDFEGLMPVIKIHGESTWGSGVSWSHAESIFFRAISGKSERSMNELVRTPKGLGRIIDIDVQKGKYLIALGGAERQPRWFKQTSCKDA